MENFSFRKSSPGEYFRGLDKVSNRDVYKVYGYRWVVLFAFCLANMCAGILMVSFAGFAPVVA